MKPTFLGIGAPRAGTTWLSRLIESHPDAFFANPKEVHFFDRYYDKGWGWYEAHFPDEADRYTAMGEFTPHYLFQPEVAERIAAEPSIRHLIAILRNPVDRAFSHYTWRMQMDFYRKSFSSFLEDYPEAIEWSSYAGPVEHYLERFGPDRFLVLIYEDVFSDVERAKQLVATHLGLDPARFPEDAGAARVNTAVVPRFGRLYSMAMRVARLARDHDMHWLNDFLANKAGLRRVFGRRTGAKPKLSPEDRLAAYGRFEADIDRLERVIGADLSAWRVSER